MCACLPEIVYSSRLCKEYCCCVCISDSREFVFDMEPTRSKVCDETAAESVATDNQHVVAYLSDSHCYTFVRESDKSGTSQNSSNSPIVNIVELPEALKHGQVTIEVYDDKLINEQPYMKMSYTELLQDYSLFHFVVADNDTRALLVNVTQSVDDVILKICATYGISSPEEYFLWYPKGVEHTLGHKTSTLKRMAKRGWDTLRRKKASDHRHADFNRRLDGKASLIDQYDLAIRPYILYLSKQTPGEEETDSGGQVGEEWPDFEDPALAVHREFNQCWCGVVQGDYPLERNVAVHIAALLCQVYHGDYVEKQLSTYRPEVFLPHAIAKSPAAAREVIEDYRSLKGKSRGEAMKSVVELCHSSVTYEGLFFPVEVPVSSSTLPRTRDCVFGINYMGVINVDTHTGKVLFVHRFSDIHNYKCTEEGTLYVDFLHWDTAYHAHSIQAETIADLLGVYTRQKAEK